MPVQRRGFFFRHFEKMLCAVVLVGILMGGVYVSHRGGDLAVELNTEQVKLDIKNMVAAREKPPPVVEEPELAAMVAAQSQNVREPQQVPDVTVTALPAVYPSQRVGVDMEFDLEFNAPLREDSVSIEGAAMLVQIVQHPVDDDYSKVRLKTTSLEGEANVTGIAADRKHIFPVVVDAEVGKTPYAPTGLTAEALPGGVAIAFTEDPRIAEDAVWVSYYEVWRRDWSDALGQYEMVYQLRPDVALGTEAESDSLDDLPRDIVEQLREQFGDNIPRDVLERVRRDFARTGARREEESPVEEGQLTWTDTGVTPGARYGYKVCTVGSNTYPTRGEPTGVANVEVPPMIDFRFLLTGPGSVRFEIAKRVGTGSLATVRRKSFWVAVGDEIGGVEADRTTQRLDSFLTGYILVDFHSQLVDTGTGRPTSRVIYADQNGMLYERRRNETGSDELWKG